MYTGGLKGYFEPCGCQADMLGGFPRLFSLFDGLPKTRPPFVFCWMLEICFFEKLKISKAKKAQSRLKARMIAELFKKQRYRALGVGPYDLVYGIKELKALTERSGAQVLAANLLDIKTKQLLFPASVVLRTNSLRLGFFSLTGVPAVKAGSKVSFPKDFWTKRGLILLDPVKAAQKAGSYTAKSWCGSSDPAFDFGSGAFERSGIKSQRHRSRF